jgi:hypothetical protein
LSYFKAAGWETEWIETAEAIVRAEFERTYATTGGDESACDEPIEVQAKMKVS